MGNSCNKVTPIFCTARVTCTVPVWCAVSHPESKIYPDVIEPKQKEEALPSFLEAAPSPTPPPTAAAAPLSATAPPATPNGQAKPALTLDPIEPFQSMELRSPAVVQRTEAVVAVEAEPADDNPTTSIADAASSKASREQGQMEITCIEPIGAEEELERPAPCAALEKPAEDAEDVAAHESASYGKSVRTDHTETAKAAGESDSAQGRVQEDDTEFEDTASQTSTTESSASEEPADEEGSSESEAEESGSDVSSEDSSAELGEFTFGPDALFALGNFELRDKVEILASRQAGRAVVEVLQALCLYALDAGAATQNCHLLLTQIRIIIHVLAHGQQTGARKAKLLLEQLHPILLSAETAFRSWSHKGTVAKFMSGRAADDEFLELHLQLKDFAQNPTFLQLLSSLDPHEAAELADLQAAQQLSGYCSVEASRVAFERLLLLFILRYRPTKCRTQKQRLIDLLAAYNNNMGKGAQGSEAEAEPFGGNTAEEQIEHMAKTRLGRAAKHAVPLMVVLMTNMWGATADSVPRTRLDKWRMAVRMALEPLRAVTGSYQLPQVPEDDVREWVEEEVM